MTRTRLLGLLFSMICIAPLALSGCGDDSSTNQTKNDLAMTQTQPDLSASTGTTCNTALLGCAVNCSTTACVNGCVAAASPAAQVKFNALFTCATDYCNMISSEDMGTVNDAGTVSPAGCTGANDTSARCASCVKTTAESSTCSAQFSACFNN